MSTSSPAPASLASVVVIPEEDFKEWRKLDSSEPLARLRTKFWGMGMPADDEWHDDDPTQSRDDDLKPGCRVLDIDNEAIVKNKEIWVRVEYIRIYNYLRGFYETNLDGTAPAAVITGQPGVGKSVFLYYALCRSLAEKRPVIWSHNKIYYIFVEDGVYRMGKYFQGAEYKSLVWTLVDSDEFPTGVPEVLVTHNTRFFVIYASSPGSGRWSRLEQTVHPIIIVMNPWTRNGIHRAASLHPVRPESKTIDDWYDQFGPTPKICIVKPRYDPEMKKYKAITRSALEGLTLQGLRELSQKAGNLEMDQFSHKLCLITREELHDVTSRLIVMPITTHMQSRLATCMRTQDIQRLVDTYEDFDCNPVTRALSGYLFENLGHLHFQKRIIIEYAPMARLSKDNRMNEPQWHSSHPMRDEKDSELRSSRQVAWSGRVTLDVRPADTYEYGDEEFREFDPKQNTYYIPKVKNEEALDSFIWCGKHLFIFQFTVSEQHDIKTGFISRFTACDKFPEPRNWRFIFITPGGKIKTQLLKTPYRPIPEIHNFQPYSAQVAMQDYAKLTESTEPILSRSFEEGEDRESPKKAKLASIISSVRWNDIGSFKQKGNAKGKGKQRQE